MKKMLFVLCIGLLLSLPASLAADCGSCRPAGACGSATADSCGYYGSFRDVVLAWNEYKNLKDQKASTSQVQQAGERFLATRSRHGASRRQCIMNMPVPCSLHQGCEPCDPGEKAYKNKHKKMTKTCRRDCGAGSCGDKGVQEACCGVPGCACHDRGMTKACCGVPGCACPGEKAYKNKHKKMTKTCRRDYGAGSCR